MLLTEKKKELKPDNALNSCSFTEYCSDKWQFEASISAYTETLRRHQITRDNPTTMESSGADKGFFQQPPALLNQFYEDATYQRCFKREN